MALKKVKKTVVYGAVLVAHYGADLTDRTTSSSSFVTWGDASDIDIQFDDSYLEIILTGSARITTNMPAGTGYGKVRFMINGQEEYIINDIIGGINREAEVTLIRTNSLVKTMVDKTFGYTVKDQQFT